MTTELRLRKALASLVASSAARQDYVALCSALRAVHPDAAARLVQACANDETCAGLVLAFGALDEVDFSVLDTVLVGDADMEISKWEKFTVNLQNLRQRFGTP